MNKDNDKKVISWIKKLKRERNKISSFVVELCNKCDLWIVCVFMVAFDDIWKFFASDFNLHASYLTSMRHRKKHQEREWEKRDT